VFTVSIAPTAAKAEGSCGTGGATGELSEPWAPRDSLYVPSSTGPDNPSPLVVTLHGDEGDPAMSILYWWPPIWRETLDFIIVLEHLETFLDEARTSDGDCGVPALVERSLRKLVECGCLGKGFVRVRCCNCGFERLLPISCKVRGCCSSCAGRRMTEMSAHLVDSVLPIVPVRQWVLTLPFPLRYDLTWNHDRTRKVLGELNRALEDSYRAKAAARGIEGGRSGSVTVIQRVGSAINLNPHFHNLSLDGVFTQKPGEPPEFHPVGLVTDEDVAEVTALARDRVLRLLRSEGVKSHVCLPAKSQIS